MSAPPAAASRRLTFYSLLAGLCPLIPVPFLDDWTLEWVRKRLTYETLAARGLEPEEEAIRILSGQEEGKKGGGCLLAPLVSVTLYVVGKLFRKLVFVLTLRDGAARFATTFQEGYLLERAIERGVMDAATAADRGRLARLRTVILAASARVDPRPVRQLVKRSLRNSSAVVRQAAGLLTVFARRQKRRGQAEVPPEAVADDGGLAEEERLLGGLVDRLDAALWNELHYLAALDAALDAVLTRPVPPPAASPSAESPTLKTPGEP